MADPVYRRVVIKLGEYLAGSQSFGIDQPTVDRIAGDRSRRQLGTEVAVVVGGGISSVASKSHPAAVLPDRRYHGHARHHDELLGAGGRH